MNDSTQRLMQPTLTGNTVELRPLQREHAHSLLDAAADGQLWKMKLTVGPGPDTIASYIATARLQRQSATTRTETRRHAARSRG